MEITARIFEQHNKISPTYFIENVINQEPQPENIPKQIRELKKNYLYIFSRIYNDIYTNLKDKLENDDFLEHIELPEDRKNYSNNYNYLDETNIYIKLLIFLKNKTPKFLHKYINKFYKDSIYYYIITSYLVYYNNCLRKSNELKLEKAVLPPSLRKVYKNCNYFENDIYSHISFVVREEQNIRINNYVEEFLIINLNRATIKDCITFKSKLKKEHPLNIKKLEKLERDKEEILNNYDEPDFQYILDEINHSIEQETIPIENLDLILFCINLYIDYIKTHQ
jgi:hypothetical protein